MKGATADPWAITMSPPKTTEAKNTGIKTYFFLCFTKRTSSRRMSTIPLECSEWLIVFNRFLGFST